MQFDVTAVANTVDGPLGFDSQAGPPAALPVAASADSTGTTDVATAGAFGGPGLLTTSADVSAAAGIANAVGTSHFMGSFVNPGPVSLSIELTPTDFSSGTGTAASSLFVSLTSGGSTLFADYVTGLWQFTYDPMAGSTSVLDLTLSSEVAAAFPQAGTGDASGFGLTTFGVSAVPEASTWLMFCVGLGVLGWTVTGTRRQRGMLSQATATY